MQGQQTNITYSHRAPDETITIKIDEGSAWIARTHDLALNHPRLTVTGDFTGNGRDELAEFAELNYTPNMNPHYSSSLISLFRSEGSRMVPAGTWFREADTVLTLEYLDFTLTGDFNMDGLDDIALFYNDPSSETQTIYVLESTGIGFSKLKPYYTGPRNEFNFTAINFVCGGNFTEGGKPGIAVFYNYFGTAPDTPQRIFLFESDGSNLVLEAAIYSGTKNELDFSGIRFALPEDYDQDLITDIALIRDNLAGAVHELLVFEGSAAGAMSLVNYLTIPGDQPGYPGVLHAITGKINDDERPDLLLLHRDPDTGYQEALLMEGNEGSFTAPEAYETPLTKVPFDEISYILAGKFLHRPLAYATTWQNSHCGAISFTFDDGTLGAFEHGAPALEAAGLSATFYVFTATTLEYDAPVAGIELMRKYQQKGFEIASHTFNHSNLGLITASQDYDSLSQVLTTSKNELDQLFDQQTISMSIPFGSFRQATLDSISRHFMTARSSQFGFNLASPYDFFALKSWPILSTTSPAYVDALVSTAETYATYLPLMYHDILDEPFDEENLIYTYSLDKFRETIALIKERDVWIATHADVYKYIREREALEIEERVPTDADGSFSLILNDGLDDSVFDVALTLRISVPGWWDNEMATIGVVTLEGLDSIHTTPILSDSTGSYILFNQVPIEGIDLHISEALFDGIDQQKATASRRSLNLSASPNPFQGETTITMEGELTEAHQIFLLNPQGSILRSIAPGGNQGNNISISISGDDLPPGMYIITVQDSQGRTGHLKLLKY